MTRFETAKQHQTQNLMDSNHFLASERLAQHYTKLINLALRLDLLACMKRNSGGPDDNLDRMIASAREQIISQQMEDFGRTLLQP